MIGTPTGRAGFAAIAAALAALLGATTSLAATTTLKAKVSNGGSYTATASKTVLSDNGVNVTCTSVGTTPALKATGSIPSGTTQGTSPLKIGTVGTLAFHNCTGPLGKVTTKVGKLPYSFKVDSATNSKGQTDVLVSGVSTSVSMTGCAFTVTGSAPGFYTNSTHTITLTSSLPVKPLNTARLTVGNVVGCAGIVKNGDHPGFAAAAKSTRGVVIVIIIIT
jgi:hypothetical protein